MDPIYFILSFLGLILLWLGTMMLQYWLLDSLQVGEMKFWERRLGHRHSIVLIISRTDLQELTYQLAVVRY
jgi:hypothetical protein